MDSPYQAPDAWARRTAGQVRAWGFNTASAFSSPNLPLPSIPELDLGWRARFLWADPFDPSVEERMMTQASEAVAPYKANAYRIGYFSDNEVGWWNGALFSYYLKRSCNKSHEAGTRRSHPPSLRRRLASIHR